MAQRIRPTLVHVFLQQIPEPLRGRPWSKCPWLCQEGRREPWPGLNSQRAQGTSSLQPGRPRGPEVSLVGSAWVSQASLRRSEAPPPAPPRPASAGGPAGRLPHGPGLCWAGPSLRTRCHRHSGQPESVFSGGPRCFPSLRLGMEGYVTGHHCRGDGAAGDGPSRGLLQGKDSQRRPSHERRAPSAALPATCSPQHGIPTFCPSTSDPGPISFQLSRHHWSPHSLPSSSHSWTDPLPTSHHSRGLVPTGPASGPTPVTARPPHQEADLTEGRPPSPQVEAAPWTPPPPMPLPQGCAPAPRPPPASPFPSQGSAQAASSVLSPLAAL